MKAKFFTERYGEENPPVKIIAKVELSKARYGEFNSNYLAEYDFIRP